MARETNRGALAGRILNEQYVLIGLLGVGGMAEVYRGDDLALERDVAVKVLPRGASDDPALVARFRDEARRVAALNHPRIVPIYHLGDDQGLVYIVMPLMRGSLRDLLRREGTLPPAEAIRLVQQVAAALDAAHAAGIVHRDVKPENILLDVEGSAHLSDFGIARSFAGGGAIPTLPSLANGAIPAGTPQYMAPEQLAGEPLDQRTDVYGLAAVLYELLAGEPPHGAGPLHEVIGRAIAGGIPPLAQRAPAVWPQLEAAVAKGLAHDRARRYQTARELSLALDAALRAHLERPAAPADVAALPTIPEAAGALAASGLAGATPVSPDASTVPLSQPPAAAITGGGARPRRRLAVALAVLAVLALLTTASGAYYLATTSGDRSTAGSGSATGSAATATARAVGAGSPARGIATRGATPSASSGTPSATATTPTPTATPTLSVAVAPQPLVLQPDGVLGECKGTQTITNKSIQAIDWSWSASFTSAPPPVAFHYDVNGGQTSSGQSTSFTRDNEPSGAADTLVVKVTPCGASATVHFTAALAGTPSQTTSFDFQLTS